MPTDPFVPSELGDRPRQQQNLPPGLALPPARDWRADRPGDLGRARPPERRAARPARVRTSATRTRSRRGRRTGSASSPHEHADDVDRGVAEIAGKRAAPFGRAPVIGDIDVAIALLGYDGTADDAFVELRARLVHDAAHDYTAPARARRRGPRGAPAPARPALAERVAAWRAQARLDLSSHLA